MHKTGLHIKFATIKTRLLFFLLMPTVVFAQKLDEHLWKDRVLLIMSDSYQNKEFIRQLEQLCNDVSELEERKLIIYQIAPTSYRKGFSKHTIKRNNLDLYTTHTSSKVSFKIKLIGLDGSVKLTSKRATKIISSYSFLNMSTPVLLSYDQYQK